MVASSLLAVLPLVGLARAHASIWHPSMFGFNVTQSNSPQYGGRDNRPEAPLKGLPFSQWWMHGHLDQPPHPNDIMELPAGGKVTTELACSKGATSYFNFDTGGDHQNGNDPCPGPPSKLIHTNGIDDLGGCALAIAYKSDANSVKPEDFVVFSVNHRCVWDRYTDFPVPANMPECPDGKCTCAWFWQHREDAGGDEMYMNGFQCKITGATATTAIPQGQVPVRCADDSSKCVKGAKQPMYWDQAEGNNMFDGIYTPPVYLDTYGFADGAQNDIWDTVGGSSGAAKSSSSASSTTASASTSSAAAAATTSTSAEAAATSPASVEAAATSPTSAPDAASSPTSAPDVASAPTSTPDAAPTSTPAAAAAASNESGDGSTTSETPAATTPAAQQGGGSVKAADPTTSATPTASLTQGGQGQRTCRPKKAKRSLRRHVRRSRAL